MTGATIRQQRQRGIADRVARARMIREWWTSNADRPGGVVGLALSGGGIRSATFSLGLIQALARCPREAPRRSETPRPAPPSVAKRIYRALTKPWRGTPSQRAGGEPPLASSRALDRIDILSTVSGGGYIGTFLRSLFLPQGARGIGADTTFETDTGAYRLDPDDVARQADFAERVLASGPDQKNIEDGRRNPIWWLREHSRYLAPNGPTDYGYAVAYLSRNWGAMLYIFALAIAAVMAFVTIGEAALQRYAPPNWLAYSWYELVPAPKAACPEPRCIVPIVKRFVPLSPIMAIAIIPFTLTIVFNIAYWLSQAMSANEPRVARQRGNLGKGVLSALLGGAVIAGLWWWTGISLAWPPGLAPRQALLAAGLALTASAAVAIVLVALPDWSRTLLTAETRRRLTKRMSSSNFWLLCVLTFAALDSCGAGLAFWWRNHLPAARWSFAAGFLGPIAAYLLKKLPEWTEKKGQTGVMGRLRDFLPAIALVLGIALYGSVAVVADAFLHIVAWTGDAWVTRADLPSLTLAIGTIWVLALVSGRATGFINLSSLHLLYATRLTRAYLGASNADRLRKAADPGPGGEITDNDDADYIRPCLYGQTDLPAPIHIINVTVNETIDPHSQLVARDRKGSLLSVEPAGIRADRHSATTEQADSIDRSARVMENTALTPWAEIGRPRNAEDISLGQWCAISGAAASSGMGRLTNLGYALALTFANVRLGYWWWSPGVCRDVPPPSRIYEAMARWFGTFVYLANELTARYSRGYERKYLTDGGHFENSGAYALIRRRVPLIIVADNGADPDYRFADLENLIRTVRLDLGAEMTILGGGGLIAFLDTLGCIDRNLFVDPVRTPAWQNGFGALGRSDAILALRVDYPDAAHRAHLNIVWVKPRLFEGLPHDLVGYAGTNTDFPQQTTANQFFGEAQWESYRKLGQLTMERLLKACPSLLAPL